MQRTKIEWADYTWNPIKGLCPVGCWYCYARKIYKRFKKDLTPRLDEKEVFEPINSFKSFRKFGRIFVCSTFELFHPIADKWRDLIFETIELDKGDTFIILTKMPERIDRPMPNNVWLGTTITGGSNIDINRTEHLAKAKAKIVFVSFEPLLDRPWLISMPLKPNWIIVGKLTGHGKRHDPTQEMLENIVGYAAINGIPIFMKNNLKDIWNEPLIQEFPRSFSNGQR